MNTSKMIKGIFTRNIYQPLYHKIYRKDSGLKFYRFVKNAQWNSLEENQKFQGKRLYNLLKYSAEKIPYYKKIVEENKITISEKTIFEDINKFPVLTKADIRKEFNNLHQIIPGLNWYFNTSGGSTGEPIKLIQDINYQADSSAMTRLQFDWAGYQLGDPQVKLWGSEKDIFKQRDKMKHKFANWVKSITLLNAFCMDEKKMKGFVDIINKEKPTLILAYAQSINEFANFIKHNNYNIYSPKAIMTSANVLHPFVRKNLEHVFDCQVYDRYGSREVGNIASECEKHEGLHISIFTHYVEILNKKMQPCKEGELGEIYITLLSNYTMPLIRYKIGDLAIYTQKTCSCKRGLPLLKEVIGRDNDLFITKRGEYIHTGIINMQFYFKPFISKYQVIQEKKNRLLVRVCLNDKYKRVNMDWELNEIKKNLLKIMGADCQVNFEITKDIKVTKSGKYRYTIRDF
jgi:phenylacetate-CoA ligase